MSSCLPPHGLYSPQGASVHGFLQARILEWVATPFSRESFDSEIKPGSPALQADLLSHQGTSSHLIVVIVISNDDDDEDDVSSTYSIPCSALRALHALSQ